MSFAITFVIIAQFVGAVASIVEEKLLHDVQASPILVVGMEGLWSLILCSFVFMPITQFIPGVEGDGLHEDTIDTFHMLIQNKLLAGLMVAFFFCVFIFNISGMLIISVSKKNNPFNFFSFLVHSHFQNNNNNPHTNAEQQMQWQEISLIH